MLDQLYVTVAYSDLDVKFIGAYVGLFTGKAGATHQSDKELSVLLRVPRLTILEPSCNAEMRQVMRAAVTTPGPGLPAHRALRGSRGPHRLLTTASRWARA